jgi:hypothetical protein
MKRASSVLAIVLGLYCLPVSAQNWRESTTTDPMSDKTYSVFALQGSGIEENFSATIALSCADGKFQRAGLTVQGMTFHYDSYAAFRNPPYVTNAKVRTGTKVEFKAFLVSQDLRTAQVSHDELEKMMNAGSAIIEFSDGSGTIHHVRFDGMSPFPKMAGECSLKISEEKQK